MAERSVIWTDSGRLGSCSAKEGSATKEDNFVGFSEQASRRNDFHGCQEAVRIGKVARPGKSASYQRENESAKRSPSHAYEENSSNKTRSKRPCPEKIIHLEHSDPDPKPPTKIDPDPKPPTQSQMTAPESSKEAGGVVFGGGVFTSRLPSPTPRMIWTKSNRMRVEDNRIRLFPDFPGCPDWVKPLMYVEYQVI